MVTIPPPPAPSARFCVNETYFLWFILALFQYSVSDRFITSGHRASITCVSMDSFLELNPQQLLVKTLIPIVDLSFHPGGRLSCSSPLPFLFFLFRFLLLFLFFVSFSCFLPPSPPPTPAAALLTGEGHPPALPASGGRTWLASSSFEGKSAAASSVLAC